MELWIRSQDKVLLEKVYAIKIEQYHNESIKEEDFTFDIVVNNDYVFGEYKTKERALEVLNEIQKILTENKPSVLTYTNGDIVNIDGNIIYEMPEK